MSTVTKSLYESRWENGYAQLFSYYTELLSAGTVNYVFNVGSGLNFALRAFILECSAVETLTWQSFAGTQYTDATGTEIIASPRNSLNNKLSESKLIINPTVTDDGIPLVTPARTLLAENFAGNRFYLRQNLLGSGLPEELLMLQKDVNYMVRVTNPETPTAKLNLIAQGWNQ